PHTFTTSHPHIYTTSLHDALPISYFCERQHRLHLGAITILQGRKAQLASVPHKDKAAGDGNNILGFLADFQVSHAVCIACGLTRSEEHTSELQSRFDLVCRLPLEK